MADERISALIPIPDGGDAEAKPLRQNFTYLDERINLLSSAIANKETLSSKGRANGYCPLDSYSQIPISYLNSFLENISPSLLPVGAIMMWSTTTPPENWIAMVGQSITNEAYADLRSVIGRDSLPNTIDRVPQGNNTPLNTIDAGLPNITGGFNLGGGNYIKICDAWGAFSLNWYENNTDKGGSDPVWGARNADFTASRSNGIYGRSNTVQANAWTTVFIIKYK